MVMNIRRARQIIKQHNHTATLALKVLESGATDERSLFEAMRKRGWKDGQGMLKEMLHALTVAHRIRTSRGRIELMADEPVPPQRPVRHTLGAEMQRARRESELRSLSQHAARELPLVALVAANNIMAEAEPNRITQVRVDEAPETTTENHMDLAKMTPDQLTEMAAQMKQLAEQRSREMDPEQLRQLLEAGQSVVEAADLMTEAAERLREVMNAVRESRGLRTEKKV